MKLIQSSMQMGRDSIPGHACSVQGRVAALPRSLLKGPRAAGDPTFRLRKGSFCLKRKSQMSRVPSDLVVKNTAGLTGLQHPSVR